MPSRTRRETGGPVNRLALICFNAFLLLAINGAYLWPHAEPSLFYLSNLALHLGLGLILTGIALGVLLTGFRRMEPLARGALACFLASSIPALALLVVGNTRPHRWILHLHIGLALLAFVLAGLAVQSYWRGSYRLGPRGRARRRYGLAAALLVLIPAGLVGHQHYFPDEADRIRNPTRTPVSMEEEGDGPQSPFFPSSSTTTSGDLIPSDFFMTSHTCQRCHPDIYKQWYSSMHHFSSFNNQWYRKSIEYMQDVVGTRPSKWCAGCHDHAVFFNGRFDTPMREQIDTPQAQAGLACTSCHSIVRITSSMGNGALVIEYPPLHDMATSDNPLLQWAHDFLTMADPGPHKKVFMKPFHRKDTAEFCSSCHKVHLDSPVNHYRWLRGFNDYDNWQASGVSGQGARSFYYPPQPRKCVDCHMPLVDSNDLGNVDGKVHSHRFPGANTAVPLVNQDQEQLQTTIDFLQDNQVSVDIFAMALGDPVEPAETSGRTGAGLQLSSTFAVGEESESFGARGMVTTPPLKVVAPLDKIGAVMRRGDSVRVDVVLRTLGVGHFFPGGTVDAFDVWLELQAVDNHGKVIFWSGRVEDNGEGPVEKSAHMYRAYLLDEHGNLINKRNAWAARSTLYVRLIPPGAADTVRFRLNVPESSGDRITLIAKVNYRKFSWWNTQWAFAGIRDPTHLDFGLDKGYDDGRWIFQGDLSRVSGKLKEIPRLPIVVMAEDRTELRVLDRGTGPPELESTMDKADLIRWNDYGIGLLLQGDLKAAEQAFLTVTRLGPGFADGWVNVARARVREGNTEGAQEVLRKALELDPDLAKSHYFYGLTLKTQGKYDQALAHFRRALAQYPRDRVVRNQAGRILFLKRQYAEAVTEFLQVLAVDPEDLQAHYNLMLCYRGLGRKELADRERRLYLRFKADESSQFITGPVRRRHPEANNERQPIHEHGSAPLEAGLTAGKTTSSRRVAARATKADS